MVRWLVYICCLLLMVISVSTFADDIKKSKQFTFLTLADLHFDPFIACHSVKSSPCPLIVKLRELPVTAWSKILMESDISLQLYRQDSTYSLIASALQEAKKAGDAANSQFVIILGDFFGHEFRQYYRKYTHDHSASGYHNFIKKTLIFLSNEIRKTFPAIDVYMVVGNNDSYQNDYYANPQGPFFHDAANLWSRFIRETASSQKMQKEFSNAGYYAIDIGAYPKMRLIVLNTTLFSYKAKGENIAEAALQELNWLHQELAMARKNQQKILIAMHIPPQVDMYLTSRIRLFTLLNLWKDRYIIRFRSELNEFASDIAGILAAHLHFSWFQILAFDTGEIPMIGTPSISPIFGNDPGFNILKYSVYSSKVENFISYSYPLKKHVWGALHDRNQVYLSTCKYCTSILSLHELLQKKELRGKYQTLAELQNKLFPKWSLHNWCIMQALEETNDEYC